MNELGPDAREILRQGRLGDEPNAADRARIKKALTASIVAGTASIAAEQSAQAAAAGKAATSLTLASVSWKIILSITFVAAIATSVLPKNEPKTLQSISTKSWPTYPEAVEPAKTPQKTPEPETLSPAPARVLAKPQPQAPSPVPITSTSEPQTTEPNDTLLAETERLREAHGALQGGDPEKALRLLDEQTAEAEGQKLKEERAAARVLALCKLGRVSEAQAEATRFLQASPRSPLADRVRKACPTAP